MEITDLVKSRKEGKLKAFFVVRWPGKLVIRDCKLLQGEDGKLYALMPSKSYSDKQGHTRWSPIVEIEDINLLNRISAAASAVYENS